MDSSRARGLDVGRVTAIHEILASDCHVIRAVNALYVVVHAHSVEDEESVFRVFLSVANIDQNGREAAIKNQ